MAEGFLLGIVFTASIAAALFFLKFWRKTRDGLFLAFAAAFLIEGVNRMSFLFLDNPGEGSPANYLVRLLAFLMIVVAIVVKNRRRA